MDDSSLALKKDTSILADQAGIFVKTVAPYLNVGASDVSRYLMKMPNQMIDSMRFFQLMSCTTEKVDDLAEFLKTRMEKLFTAIHAMNASIAYGIISYNNNLNLVLGVENKQAQQTVKNLMEGLLSGIELEPYSPALAKRSHHSQYGGILSGIPILKIEDEKQTFDMSSMMHSMIGHDYTVLVFATPYQDQWTQNAYSQILNVRDQCFAVSKKNIARQRSYSRTEGTNKSKTTTHTFNAMLYSYSSGKTISQSVSETIGENDTTSSDVQNGMALEMMAYCDKAIERLKFGRSVGMWGTAIAYSADSNLGAAVLKASLTGELAKASEDVLPLQQYSCSIASNQDIIIPELEDTNPMLAPITSAELGMICTPPHEAVPGFELKEGKQYPMISDAGNGIVIGKISDSIRALPGMPFSLSEKDLNKHTFVCGITGSGKTTTVKGILKECSKPFMVIESAKKEYRNLSLDENRGGLEIYTLGKPEINCLQFNPFYIQCGINLQTHIDFLKDLFNASFSFYGPMPYILEQCLYNIYQKKGWNLTFGYHPYLVNLGNAAKVFDSDYMKKQYSLKSHKYLFPTMQDLKDEVKRYIETELRYDGEVGGNIETAMLARLNSLCVGSKGFMFNTNAFVDMDALMKKNVVFELEGLADDSDKAFCVGLLLVFVNEYRQVMKEESNNENLGLQHLLVIEEAHRLLKNVETERTSEVMGNPKGISKNYP